MKFSPSTPLSPLPLFHPNIPPINIDRKLYNTDDPYAPLPFLINEKQSKGIIGNGAPTTIASITADLDLAANEEQNSMGENSEQSHPNQPNQETLQQIDAVVAANCGDHEDDTDLGFDFAISPTRNEEARSNGNNKDTPPTPLTIQSSPTLNSLQCSPPQPLMFRQTTLKTTNCQPQQHNHHQQQERPSSQRTIHPPPHSYPFAPPPSHPHFAPFPPQAYHQQRNGKPVHSKMQTQSQGQYVHKVTYHPIAGAPLPAHINIDRGYNSQRNIYTQHPYSLQHQLMHPQHSSNATKMNRGSGNGADSNGNVNSNNREINTKKGGNGDRGIISSPTHDKENVDIDLNKDGGKSNASNTDGDNGTEAGLRTKIGTLLRSPPPKKRRVVGSWDENDRKAEGDLLPSRNLGNVFRSPKGNIKRSPLLGKDSVSFGASFEMSPSSKFDDIFPPTNSFEINESLTRVNSYDGKVVLSRSMSEDDIVMPPSFSRRDIQQKKIQGSPCLMFGSMLSPLRSSPSHKRLQGNERGTVLSSTTDITRVFDSSPIPSRPPSVLMGRSTQDPIVLPSMTIPKNSVDKQVHSINFSPDTSGNISLQRLPGDSSSNHPAFASPGTFRLQVRFTVALLIVIYYFSYEMTLNNLFYADRNNRG